MIPASELILRPDGTVYHLGLNPEQIAPTIITVGDPKRVNRVSRRFDRIDHRVARREFVTHTGELDGRRLTVIATGIGTDNIDIVLNELDALVNIDLERREVRDELTRLTFLRLGTSGAFQPDIPLDSIVLSRAAVSYDGLLPFYPEIKETEYANGIERHLRAHDVDPMVRPRVVAPDLPDFLKGNTDIRSGITLTAAGFYAPQGRQLRLRSLFDDAYLSALRSYRADDGGRITNIEMETAGIYGLATALGHRSASLSVLLANRALGTFSDRPGEAVEELIERGLSLLV